MVSVKSTTRLLFVVIWTIVTFIECYWFDAVQNTQQNMALVSWIVVWAHPTKSVAGSNQNTNDI